MISWLLARVKQLAARVFFAIRLPNDLQALMGTILHSLKITLSNENVRWVSAQKLHVTLAFLGQIEEEDLLQLITQANHKLKDVKPFYMKLNQLSFFPKSSREAILSLRAGPHRQLTNLAIKLRQAIQASHYPVENRPFRAHLTLGRLPYFKTMDLNLDHVNLPHIPEFLVSNIYLLESTIKQGISCYVSLAEFRLK
jgi:2'-5' RNA ligase